MAKRSEARSSLAPVADRSYVAGAATCNTTGLTFAAAAGTGVQAAAQTILVAETSADGNASAALSAATAKYSGSALGLHAGAKAMSLDSLAAVGLKCALGH